MDVLHAVGLSPGANVTTATERTHGDHVRVKAERDVTGEATVKATLEGERERRGKRERERERENIFTMLFKFKFKNIFLTLTHLLGNRCAYFHFILH